MVFDDIFPVRPDDLKPAVNWSAPGPYGIPINPGQIYGLPTGARNGIWVLDLDVKNGKNGVAALEAYMRENDTPELPPTRMVRTKSGGLHLYFALPEGRRIGNRVSVLPGVDVRGEGGFVYAGGPYEVEEDVAPAEADEWLLALVESKRDAAPVIPVSGIAPGHPEYERRVAMAVSYLQTAEPCISGINGQKMIWLVALQLSRTLELPVDLSMALVAGYNARCQPPWDAADWRRTLERAAEHGTTIPGTGEGFAEGFMAPPAAEPTPSGPTAWRQVVAPKRRYSFDTKDIFGAPGKLLKIGQKDLTTLFLGPSCPREEWRGVWQYDAFARRMRAVNPPLALNAETIGLESVDLLNIQIWLAYQGYDVSTDMIHAAIQAAASRCAFHPVREYLDALPVIGKSAAEKYFEGLAARLWGALDGDDVVESDYLRRFAIAAVRRIRVPGTKVDTILVLQGRQGTNKSRFAELLFSRAFFSDQVRGIESKEGSIALEGIWGAELGEMAHFEGLAESIKKDFLSRCVDKYRPVYGRGVIERPRETVFLGTTNQDDFLTDATGSRRYWICKLQRPIDLTAFDRDAFWAAACALESAGEKHWYDAGEVTAKSADGSPLARRNAEFEREDPWTVVVLAYAEKRLETDKCVLASDCLDYGLLVGKDKQDDRAMKRVRAILRAKFGPARVFRVGDKTPRGYAPAEST